MSSRSTVFERSIRVTGKAVPDALVRQALIPGFDQARYSRAHVLCVGAGGLVSHVAPALVRKGIGALTILDDDLVEASNLNRQHFYTSTQTTSADRRRSRSSRTCSESARTPRS